MTKARNVAVIGLGDFGASLAIELTRFGDRVLGIDSNSSRVTALGQEMEQVVQADARDMLALKELALPDYDVTVVAIGDNMESSLTATMNAKEIGCDALWVKAQGHVHERILRQIDVEHVVLPEQQAGRQIAERIHNPVIKDFMNVSEKSYIARLDVDKTLAGKNLNEADFYQSKELSCIAIERDGALQDLNSVILQTGDTLIMYGNRRSMHRLRMSD